MRKLWARMERLRVGDPMDKNTDVGAINSAEQLARITALVEAGEREGATRRSVSCALPEHGYWFPPTMFLDVAPANRIAVEEIFGPVVSVTTFRTPAEAVERANNSAYGLAAGVWTDNGAKAFEVASQAARRRGLAEHLQQVRPDGRVRRVQGERVRPRGRARRAGAVREVGRMSRRVGGRQDVQALPGRRVRAFGVRRGPTRHEGRGQRAARLAQGRPRRGQGRARRRRRVGEEDGLQPRAGAVPVRGGAGVALESCPRRSPRTCAATRESASRRPARPLRGLDGQARRGDGRREPGRGAVPVVLRRRSRPASSRCSRRTRPTCWAWCARSPRRLAAGNTVVAIVSRR